MMAENLEKQMSMPDFEDLVLNEAVKSTADKMKVMQVNLGRLCNLACKHCHLAAGPNRTEIMSREVLEACLEVYQKQGFSTIDITGGAPEMNPHFEWFLNEAGKICNHVIVRTNLVILLEKKYQHLTALYAGKKIELVCSLPYYQADRMDKVRGEGTFEGAVKVMQILNGIGYGVDPDLVLNVVYNPAGAFFPPVQESMEKEYKQKLGDLYGVSFNHLFAITNNPTGRFKAFLEKSGNFTDYMNKLYHAFNSATLPAMMCRFQLSVGYDGRLYDCDFNQAAGFAVTTGETIFDMVGKEYLRRRIFFGNHCYACTAGQGSSCGGTTE